MNIIIKINYEPRTVHMSHDSSVCIAITRNLAERFSDGYVFNVLLCLLLCSLICHNMTYNSLILFSHWVSPFSGCLHPPSDATGVWYLWCSVIMRLHAKAIRWLEMSFRDEDDDGDDDLLRLFVTVFKYRALFNSSGIQFQDEFGLW